MNMKKLLSFVLVLSLVFSLAVPVFTQDIETEPVYYDDEIWSLMDFDRVDSSVWYFSEVVGPAIWGTPTAKRAAEEMAELFRSYGIEDVVVSELPRNINGGTLTTGYLPELIIHDYKDPKAAKYEKYGYDATYDKGISVARGSTNTEATRTGPEGVTGTIVYAGDGLTAADFPAATAGNIALIERRTKTAAQVEASYALAVAAGAKAVLFVAPEPAPKTGSSVYLLVEPNFVSTGPATGWPTAGTDGTAGWSTTAIASATTPYAFVPDYAAEYLRAEPDTVVTYRMQGYTNIYNAVATIPGPSEDCDSIIFTCHTDTVTSSPGGNDNRTGMAAVLEMARVYKILADQGKLDKEIILAACGGEELGDYGSNAIANARAGTGFTPERISRIKACYNFDMVAPADPWNAGMTLTLRQHYGSGNVPPIDDIVSINSIAAAQRLGLPVIDLDKRNDTGELAIKLTNGSGSDHQYFGAKGIPNANHSIRGSSKYPAVSGDNTTAAWNGTVSLESRYHTAGDTFYDNYSPEKMKVALKVAAASSYAIVGGAGLHVVTDGHLVKAGQYFHVNAFFGEVKNSNAAILNYSFDNSKFEYRGYTPAEGVTVLNTENTDDGVKITVMIADYKAKNFGEVLMSAKTDVDLQNEDNEIVLKLDYVIKDAKTDEKKIYSATAGTVFTSTGENPDPQPGDVTLIDLSNIIDLFGITKTHELWNSKYKYFDHNNNGEIDIHDISYVAKLIK